MYVGYRSIDLEENKNMGCTSVKHQAAATPLYQQMAIHPLVTLQVATEHAILSQLAQQELSFKVPTTLPSLNTGASYEVLSSGAAACIFEVIPGEPAWRCKHTVPAHNMLCVPDTVHRRRSIAICSTVTVLCTGVQDSCL